MSNTVHLAEAVGRKWKDFATVNNCPTSWEPRFTSHRGWQVINRDARPSQKQYPYGMQYFRSREFLAALEFATLVKQNEDLSRR